MVGERVVGQVSSESAGERALQEVHNLRTSLVGFVDGQTRGMPRFDATEDFINF